MKKNTVKSYFRKNLLINVKNEIKNGEKGEQIVY